ncbi:hypothetical protein BN946_scf184829.g68 [Trametes cinnabarina]|uniref:Cullin family profile domain-containing protein n=1 Tax=Pycnoporus cinnabarinus TaxID=5643 RepID=A0A060SFD9_PYCCI|nr:hypothetical protein BN946_scf184829.g68 [Trametes cinnabarina]
MQDVFTLLTLPQTSKAFSALPVQPQTAGRTSTREPSRSASPPRKVARLDAASDAASGSSVRTAGDAQSIADRRGPILLRVVGHPIKPVPDSVNEADYALVRRTIRMLVTPGETGTLPATYDRIYRACRAAVTEAGKGEGIYEAVKMELERCVGTIERTLASEERKSVEWLVPFTDACAWFEKQVGLLQSLLAYLDTIYVAEQPQLPKVKQLAYSMFTDSVIKSARITQAITTGIADWLEWERTNRASHPLRSYIPRLVQHTRAHGLYADIVESTYITLTHTFYIKESDELASAGAMSAKDFLAHVQARSKEELERAQEVLLLESVAAVQDTADNALLAGRLQWLAKDALESLMAARNDAQLKKMYKLFAKVGGLSVLSAAFKLYIQKTVKAIVTDEEHDEEMVPRLLEFKAFADKLVTQAFVDETPSPAAVSSSTQPAPSSSKTPLPPAPAPATHPNREFQYGLRDAFHAGFKARRNKPAEMIAKHLDRAMRRGQKGKRDEDFAAELDEVLALYPFTDDNDRSNWPFTARKNDIDLPPWMQQDLADYTEFYKKKHQGRKLDWDHALGTATLKARFNAGEKELSVSLYQAVILLLFNEETTISYADIKEQTRLGAATDDAELQRTLQSLACGKKRVLRKQPSGKDVNPTDVFHFNADFTDPRYQVHINSIQSKETPEESKRTQSSIEADRKHALDAAIVRVMKAKKELSYEQLKTATIEAVKKHFVPEVGMIKQRIQGLVEQEYLRRDEDDMNKYIYVA